MIKNPKIGQEIWFKATYCDINSGKITEICDFKTGRYVKLKGTRETYGSMGAKIEDCYETKDALLKGLSENFDKLVNEYVNEIKDVNDLVQFMYNHCVCTAEEYTEWEARKAARIRAKELLGIDLDN